MRKVACECSYCMQIIWNTKRSRVDIVFTSHADTKCDTIDEQLFFTSNSRNIIFHRWILDILCDFCSISSIFFFNYSIKVESFTDTRKVEQIAESVSENGYTLSFRCDIGDSCNERKLFRFRFLENYRFHYLKFLEKF